MNKQVNKPALGEIPFAILPTPVLPIIHYFSQLQPWEVNTNDFGWLGGFGPDTGIRGLEHSEGFRNRKITERGTIWAVSKIKVKLLDRVVALVHWGEILFVLD
jgi:hypothetical protein